MAKNNREIEAKFYLPELLSIRDDLISSGARISSERGLERNWRFDNPDRRFEKTGEVLRVRMDRSCYLTYKRPTETPEDRIEIDLEISDGESAVDLLEALGFEVVTIYEKYRETFLFEEGFIFLDELPFGYFVEVEGESIDAIKHISETLGLNWEKRVPKNYLEIFLGLIKHLSLPFSDATFDNFSHISPVSAQDINLQSAFD
jgi:adenylate cyclase class 2